MLYIVISQYQLLIRHEDQKIALPQAEHINSIEHLLSPITKTQKYFVASLKSELPANLAEYSLQLINLRQALSHFDDELLREIVYYQQLNSYYATHKFCGTCGSQTISQEKNKFLFCANCKQEIYPHIAPSIIVRIHKDEQILMARGVGFAPGAWGLIAGFVEIGESLEEAVAREVKEEVGIEIKDIKYWGSQPWPFPSNSLMLGFTANYKSGDIIIDPIEIEQAGFYSKDNYPGLPFTSYSIASKMLNEYLSS